MSSPLLGASDFNLDELDAFLMSDLRKTACSFPTSTEFLGGIATGPELIMPRVALSDLGRC